MNSTDREIARLRSVWATLNDELLQIAAEMSEAANTINDVAAAVRNGEYRDLPVAECQIALAMRRRDAGYSIHERMLKIKEHIANREALKATGLSGVDVGVEISEG